jgi:hypothetical protein
MLLRICRPFIVARNHFDLPMEEFGFFLTFPDQCCFKLNLFAVIDQSKIYYGGWENFHIEK